MEEEKTKREQDIATKHALEQQIEAKRKEKLDAKAREEEVSKLESLKESITCSICKEIYKDPQFRSLISKNFKIINNTQLKKSLKKKILAKKENIKKLERLIHPLVRKRMKAFTFRNKNKKLLFYEIPLLIESKLMKYFNVIIFIKANKKTRLKRFKMKQAKMKMCHVGSKNGPPEASGSTQFITRI